TARRAPAIRPSTAPQARSLLVCWPPLTPLSFLNWGGPTRPPTPPREARHAPARPWRSSAFRVLRGAPTWPPTPPREARRAPAEPWRPSAFRVLRQALLEDGLELELAADRRVRLPHFEAGPGVVVDVTVLVEAPLAVDAIEVLRGRDRLTHGLALLGDVFRALQLRRGPAEGVDDDPGALGRVEGVRGRLLAELGLVGLVRLGADASHLLERQAGERDPHVRAEGGVARGAFQQLLLGEPVRSQEAGPRRGEADLLHLSDHDLGARFADAAQIDEVSARRA